VIKRHPGAQRGRLVVGRQGETDTMTLKVEVAHPAADLQGALADSLRAITKLGGAVELVTPGSLPNDGKVIEDARTY
ncbi:MAG: phenylacetate--CoA ligase family protein, partial [Betaproteobacteria bacterium]